MQHQIAVAAQSDTAATAQRIEVLRAELERARSATDAVFTTWAQEIMCGNCFNIFAPDITDSQNCPECGHLVQIPDQQEKPRS